MDRRGGGAGSGAIGGDSSVEVADGEIPEETAGPYPGDGSNGVNVLTESGIVRSDLTSSFGDASGVAEGVPVTVRLKVYDLDGEDVAALSGAAIYLWHCDRDGNYSMYSEAVADENYLRGVQETDAHGRVEFTTIFPACYSGRWPHMHFEVYQSVDDATSYTNKLRTSQLALPEDVCNDVFATDGYEQSVTNLAQISLDSDGIFSDGYSLQMATVTGSVDDGYTVSLNIPV
ncbi:intradiol ring-cleavage dioxygenase [Nocardioides sp. Root1257]|uniref:intradiol ring-cleavage dioxygenase n=1 Tax=Nocardioides sp. Root1257 TaxID=1736439 RepID=UPI0009E6C257|nr:intradiol ring-cleavage dioxygenase [Nocardioides sp. Root1257]